MRVKIIGFGMEGFMNIPEIKPTIEINVPPCYDLVTLRGGTCAMEWHQMVFKFDKDGKTPEYVFMGLR